MNIVRDGAEIRSDNYAIFILFVLSTRAKCLVKMVQRSFSNIR